MASTASASHPVSSLDKRVVIGTPRFVLRELEVADASERYLSWFADADARRYITAAATTVALADLSAYIAARMNRRDVLFLGIFDRATGLHIGNVKYEPLDESRGYAVMGILVGDHGFRGKGVAREVLDASTEWLRAQRGIREIVLGVETSNTGAIRAYEAAGFVIEATPHIPEVKAGAVTMVKRLE
jgi:ribosomal-protein-alanine N-acetyltransferase